MTAALAQISEEYAQRLLEICTLLDEKHPHQPHYYLFFSVRVLVLETCERDKVSAYLEATSEHSKRLYMRHGFQVTGEEVQLPEGPSMWRMWRTSQ